MSYLEIDSIIEVWTRKRGICLLSEKLEPGRKYFYVSSLAGETFQIVIEPALKGSVRLDAHMIESLTDEEAHFIWNVPVAHTAHGLDLSLESVRAWFKRSAT